MKFLKVNLVRELKRYFWWFGVVVLIACGGPPQPLNEEVDSLPFSDRASEIARGEWGIRLGTDLPDLPAIKWYSGECLRYPGEGPCDPGKGLRTGNTFIPAQGSGDPEIHLLTLGQSLPSETSLSHELLHWALWVHQGDGDQRHEMDLWEEVSDVNSEIRDSGY